MAQCKVHFMKKFTLSTVVSKNNILTMTKLIFFLQIGFTFMWKFSSVRSRGRNAAESKDYTSRATSGGNLRANR